MAGGLTAAGAVVLAACGEAQVVERVVTQQVEVERIVEKEVPVEVERIVTREVEKIVTREVERVIDRVVTRDVPVEVEVEVVREVEVIKEVEVVKEVPVQIEVTGVRFATDHTAGPRGKAMQWALSRFKELSPEVLMIVEPVADVIDQVAIQIAAGRAPHTALGWGAIFQPFVREGAFAEVQDVIVKEGVDMSNYWVIPGENNLPYEGALYHWGHRQYGMPYQIHAPGWMANIDSFNAAGVAVPDAEGAGWTWDDATEAFKQLTDADAGKFGNYEQSASLKSYGGTAHSAGWPFWINEDFTAGMFDHPAWVETIEWLNQIINVDGSSVQQELAKDVAGEFGDPFVAGNAATHHGSSFYIPAGFHGSIGTRFNWTLIPTPAHPGTMGIAHGHDDQNHNAFATAESQGVLEQSVKWLIFTAGEEVSDRVGIDRGNMPPWKGSIDKPATLAGPPEGMKWWKAAIEKPDNRTRGYFRDYLTFRGTVLNTHVEAELFNGKTTVQETVENMQASMATVVAESEAPATRFESYD